MADEARVQASLQIRKLGGDDSEFVLLDYQSRPTTFIADVDGVKGPTPGALTIPVGGKVIDLSELVIPGLYSIRNCDIANYVEYGIYDPETDVFYPWGEILAGEMYIGRFSRNLQEEYVGTGTGTSAPTNRVFMKADTADIIVVIEAFEK